MKNKKLLQYLEQKGCTLRELILDMCVSAGTGHVTSSMSFIDILVVLYHGKLLRHDPTNPEWEDRDRLILSKGQGSPALYVMLADAGFYDKSTLNRFAQKGGSFGVHLQKDVPGVEITCGSLGQGFGIAAGIALAAKMNRKLFLTYAILGDGELYEGSIWETAMFAAHHNLNNLVAIVDRNNMCVTDFTENLIRLEPLEDKWAAFGWHVNRINGHDYEALYDSLAAIRSRNRAQPTVIIADTIKGRGVDPLCFNPLWHGLAPSGELVDSCRLSLEERSMDVARR
jgi:transketolase